MRFLSNPFQRVLEAEILYVISYEVLELDRTCPLEEEIKLLNQCIQKIFQYLYYLILTSSKCISKGTNISWKSQTNQGPKKSKMTPKSSQNQMSGLEQTKKLKVVKLHEQTPKQLSNPIPTLKKPIRTKDQNDPKIKSKSKVRIEGNIENESCSST